LAPEFFKCQKKKTRGELGGGFPPRGEWISGRQKNLSKKSYGKTHQKAENFSGLPYF